MDCCCHFLPCERSADSGSFPVDVGSRVFRGKADTQPIPLVRKVALAPAVAYLGAQGIPVRRYLRRAKLTAPTPDTLETVILLDQLCDFL